MSWGFLLKKMIGMMFMPISVILLFLVLAIILQLFAPRRFAKLALACTIIAASLLLLLSWQPVANQLLLPFEQQYSRFDSQQKVDFVVVLGNCHYNNQHIPPQAQLCGTALYRLMEGLRILRQQPNAKIIFTGYAGQQTKSHAETMRQIALSMDIDGEQILTFPQAQDTEQEARAVIEKMKLLANDSIDLALVTSASHVPRAMMLFTSQAKQLAGKINIYPAPAFFAADVNSTSLKIETPALRKSERALYEFSGTSWLKIKQLFK